MTRYFKLFVHAAAIISVLLGAAFAVEASECGDINGDELANITDAVYLIAYIFAGGPAPECGVTPTGIGTVTDIDDNLYYTLRIGEQWWMLQNLKVTHYRNGDPIPYVTGDSEWSGLQSGAYCEYDHTPSNVDIYGRLYNWYAVDDSRGLAPDGWHVPTDEDWKQLERFLGMSEAEVDATQWRGTEEGGKMKSTDDMYWNPPNAAASNESGFSALPGGTRHDYGIFQYINISAVFWSSTEASSTNAWYRGLDHDYPGVGRLESPKHLGFSLRCVKD